MRPLNHEQAEKLRPLRKQLTAIVDEVAKIESVMLGLCDHTSTLGNCPACQLEHSGSKRKRKRNGSACVTLPSRSSARTGRDTRNWLNWHNCRLCSTNTNRTNFQSRATVPTDILTPHVGYLAE